MYTERSCFHVYLSPANPIGNHYWFLGYLSNVSFCENSKILLYIFNTLFRQKLAYSIICPAPCFFNLMYPGDHSTSVHRDLSLSCLMAA